MKNFTDIKNEVQEKYQEALRSAEKSCGRGIFRSRGKWIIVPEKIGEGEMEWDGTKKQLTKIIGEYTNDKSVGKIYIEGGINFGENFQAFDEGWYEPFVEEYSVIVWSRV
jgi:hypothetical protein